MFDRQVANFEPSTLSCVTQSKSRCDDQSTINTIAKVVEKTPFSKFIFLTKSFNCLLISF